MYIIINKMKIGVVRFPGSNCFNDTVKYFGEKNCIELWHTQKNYNIELDLLVIPGGFAFGDRTYINATGDYENDPGAMAIKCPIVDFIKLVHSKKIPILGICNGFQILIKLGLLEGSLTMNESKKFISKRVNLKYDFKNDCVSHIGTIKMNVANYNGNYQNDNVNNENVFLRYDDFSNGSIDNIAGIHNDDKSIFGMMPHPERNSRNCCFKDVLLDILFSNERVLKKRIDMLLNSEHISYKSTKQFLRNLYSDGDHVVQGPGENAGIVDIGGGYCVTIRIESHNHPTFKNAYEGAATGVGGIIRDIICMGSKPIALLDFLRFGDDDNSKKLLNRAVEGIAYYGNTIGIPNVGGSLHIAPTYNKNPLVNVACLGLVKKDKIIYGKNIAVAVESTKYPGTLWHTKFNGVSGFIKKTLKFRSGKTKDFMSDFISESNCDTCSGKRLKKESLYFKINKTSISDLNSMDIKGLRNWISSIENKLNKEQQIIAQPIIKEIKQRVELMYNLGLEYLSLDRPLRTLSGGEAQRIRLATQIGTKLVGVLYILDEPSIGLHQRDNNKLIDSLKELRDLGNTVIVVEHDRDMMECADNIIDIGPGPGLGGGVVVAQGKLSKFLKQDSITSKFLTRELDIDVPSKRRTGNGKTINIHGASGNNLRNVNLTIPLGCMVCITGVSGSGKSSLIHGTLSNYLKKELYNSRKQFLPLDKIEGTQNINKLIEVDQSPIGRTPRSNPATYTGVFTDIRNLFSSLTESKIRGLKQGAFSFNVKGGRCETCKGAGIRLVEMDFLPNVFVNCESCQGKRYNRDTLEVRYKGKSISDVLDMTVSDAVIFFKKQPKISNKLKALDEVGLGYIKLGQPSTMLSGGEAQRVKLASELYKKDTGRTLFVLDEPTTGLHFHDIQNLMVVLNRLIDRGNTVLIIEHNMDVIKCADHIIDLGPEGGDKGGYIIAEGTPERIIKNKDSYTGYFLKKELINK